MDAQPTASSAYYAQQSFMTDPHAQADLLLDLPPDIPALRSVVRGLIIHYRNEALYGGPLPAARLEEAQTRYSAKILARIRELDPRPLTIPRSPRERFVGCCRDFAVLLCTILRARGIPARVRCGFSTYIDTAFCYDHWACEYWRAEEGRWALVDVDVELDAPTFRPPAFDPCDVPRNRFLVAGRAWQRCRSGLDDPAVFGYDPEAAGLGVIRSYLLLDLACLNKVELTPWDCWGLSDQPFETLTEEELSLLDELADRTRQDDPPLQELRAIYERDARLRVPRVITCYSMADERTTALIG